jgi:hypothetical protein
LNNGDANKDEAACKGAANILPQATFSASTKTESHIVNGNGKTRVPITSGRPTGKPNALYPKRSTKGCSYISVACRKRLNAQMLGTFREYQETSVEPFFKLSVSIDLLIVFKS